MDILQSIIIAIVEGLTEFLPVSSTGHMIITSEVIGVVPDEFTKAFEVIIQFGAILSVIWLYWKRFFRLGTVPAGATGLKAFLCKYDFYWKLFVAFIPAAVLGFLLSDYIDALLENVLVVAIMLVAGGVLMLFVDSMFKHARDDARSAELSEPRALKIGLYQCIAMIPGVSRSMATIVGGMQQGLSRRRAAEFSFFLAVPTMFAASAYKLMKLLASESSRQLLADNAMALIVGNVVAFVVAVLAIKFFIEYITRHGFKAFGYYRIIVGTAIIIMMACGVDMSIF